MEKTTRKPTMIKNIGYAKCNSEKLLEFGAKYFNEFANGYYLEHEEVHFDSDMKAWIDTEGNSYKSIDDFCQEVSYWLSCYYEGGHCRHEEEYNDRRAFLKYMEVFKDYCKEKHTHWIPYNKETAFLFE